MQCYAAKRTSGFTTQGLGGRTFQRRGPCAITHHEVKPLDSGVFNLDLLRDDNSVPSSSLVVIAIHGTIGLEFDRLGLPLRKSS